MFIQQGVSTGGAGNELEDGGEGMTIGRVMDWVEARMEAIKSREEEEDEDAEGMDGRGRSAPASASALSTGRTGSADATTDRQKTATQVRIVCVNHRIPRSHCFCRVVHCQTHSSQPFDQHHLRKLPPRQHRQLQLYYLLHLFRLPNGRPSASALQGIKIKAKIVKIWCTL